MSVAIVSVHYDPNRVGATLDSLALIASRVKGPAAVLVSNRTEAADALEPASQDRLPGAVVIRHDNTGMEFGAYQRGLDALQAWGDVDWVVFANDTFSVHQVFPPAYVENLIAQLGRDVSHPVIVGQIEGLPRSYVLDGVRTHRWVTTNLFALNRASLDTLNRRVHDPLLDASVIATASRERFLSPQVDSVLRRHITDWLFEAHGSTPAWYAAAPLDTINAEAMARKARSILQEKRVSAVLEGASAEFASIRDVSMLAELALRLRRRARQLRALTV